MAIEKGLYAAPLGIDNAAEQEGPELDITIEDPEAVEIGVDGKPILRIEKSEDEEGFDDNLAEYMNDRELSQLASDLTSDFDDDIYVRF